ncbi:MAG: macro domain-containing protein [Fimbriimonadaceae bacterium]|nr:macro domain-containing protein [Fimbriimonadaceae bacterium]
MIRRPHDSLRDLQRRLRQRTPPPRPAAPWRDTAPERTVAGWLAELDIVAVAQYPLTPTLAVDFAVPAARLWIEVQGTWYHGDPATCPPDRLNHSQRRKRVQDAALQRLATRWGWRLLELWEADLTADPAGCRQRLAVHLGLAPWESLQATLRRRVTLPDGRRLEVAHGDLTSETTAAIVNAANARLAHGGGVAGAIVRRGGAVVQQESDAWMRQHGPLAAGEVALTGAGALPCRAVIHVVGPVWQGGQPTAPAALAAVAGAALDRAAREGFDSLSLPALGAGRGGFPLEQSATILVQAALAHLAAHPASSLRLIRLTDLAAPAVAAFLAAFDRRLGPPTP